MEHFDTASWKKKLIIKQCNSKDDAVDHSPTFVRA